MEYGREYILLDQTKIIDYASQEFLTFNNEDDVKTAEKNFKNLKQLKDIF